MDTDNLLISAFCQKRLHAGCARGGRGEVVTVYPGEGEQRHLRPGRHNAWFWQVGVNPSPETVRSRHSHYSMVLSFQRHLSPPEWSTVGEAEASSAGVQLAEE